MLSNIEKYKKDFDKLLSDGKLLLAAMLKETDPEKYKNEIKELSGGNGKLPSFTNNYQSWYSESLAVINVLLPNRLNDFIRFYEAPKSRKELTMVNYVIEDYLQQLTRRYPSGKIVVSPESAILKYQQQYNILRGLKERFESSLFDIQHLVQADLFDSEIETAKELNKKGFVRAAGAISGVVLEKHLYQVCSNHALAISKKNPTLSDFYDTLKTNDIIDIPTWRLIQHLSDIRNICDHGKSPEPTKEQVSDLIAGTDKIIKTIF
jgi:hypothetical protein